MFIIFGLGNPGPQYVGTRHNAGFELLDLIAESADIEINKNKFKSMVGEGFWKGEKIILIKPMTFMNLSGEAVVAALNFYKPGADEWMVVYDDMALKPGAVRIREKGSAGGHNGMKSIIGLTGTDEFIRLRIGVGGPRGNVVSHVLGKFSEAEEKPYVDGLLLARNAVETILTRSVEDAMSQFNSSGKPPKKPRMVKKAGASAAASDSSGVPVSPAPGTEPGPGSEPGPGTETGPGTASGAGTPPGEAGETVPSAVMDAPGEDAAMRMKRCEPRQEADREEEK